MVRLSAFADEISKDLTEQIDVLQSESITFLELRGVWGKNVSDFSDTEVATIKEALQSASIGVSCIGSPIGKMKITDDFSTHLLKFRRVMEIAKALDTRYIRVFSFFIPENSDPSMYRDEVIRRMRVMTEAAEEQNLVLLHENEKEIYGDTGARCVDILSTIASPSLRAIFDPANFVQVGQHPYEDCWNAILPYLEYMHVKDALHKNRKAVPTGEGDGNWRSIAASLKDTNFQGFMSLEPHLSAAGRMSGFSGPDLFRVASRALKTMLAEMEIAWS